MITTNDINAALNKMILSASGWRAVFSFCGGEECKSEKISDSHRIICAAAAFVFADYLYSSIPSCANINMPLVLLGTDTRPTGKSIAEAVIPVLLSKGCRVRYTGVTAAPEIMAWAGSFNDLSFDNGEKTPAGFIYISASHNPVGHNGLKFGLTDGGVLSTDEVNILIENFKTFLNSDDNIKNIEKMIISAEKCDIEKIYYNSTNYKSESEKIYQNFCNKVIWDGSSQIAGEIKDSLLKYPFGIVCDFNGSARTVSIDRNFLRELGFKFESINDKPGEIAHRIVPEGESLEPCRVLLEEAHKRDASFILGYVPDCDGDRGNLVIFDGKKARALEAQEVFALACIAEFSQLVWAKGNVSRNALDKTAVAINDPTSMRIDRIAEAFCISVYRAEVGEANVVSLARKLRGEGYTVRILGEGSAGGNITHPSAVRDPLHTVMAIAKLLSIRSTDKKAGFFEIWCRLSNQTNKYKNDFTLADIIESMPKFTTTAAYNEDAVLRIKTADHALLKDRYKDVFLREWEERKDELRTRFNIHGWEAVAYNGITEKRRLSRFGEAGKGGLKILFTNDKGRKIAYIWMRGSATEPVFRVMADTEGENIQFERDLLKWQSQMIMEADVRG